MYKIKSKRLFLMDDSEYDDCELTLTDSAVEDFSVIKQGDKEYMVATSFIEVFDAESFEHVPPETNNSPCCSDDYSFPNPFYLTKEYLKNVFYSLCFYAKKFFSKK